MRVAGAAGACNVLRHILEEEPAMRLKETLPLEQVEAPEDWTAPLDDVEIDDLGYSETDMTTGDWTRSLQPIAKEAPERTEWAAANAHDRYRVGPFRNKADAMMA
jgi:hypothetical protein